MDEPSSPGSETHQEATVQPASGKKVGRGIRAACKRRKLPSWTPDEELALARLHMEHGNSWAGIAERLNGRTAAEAKNIWHSTLRARTPTGRSLLLEYARNVMGKCGDSKARREAFRNAVKLYGHLHGLNTGPAGGGGGGGGGGGNAGHSAPATAAADGGANRQPLSQNAVHARRSGSGIDMEADNNNNHNNNNGEAGAGLDSSTAGGRDCRPTAFAAAAGRLEQLPAHRPPARASGSQVAFGDSGGGVAGLAAGSSRSGSLNQQTSGDSNPTSHHQQQQHHHHHQQQQQQQQQPQQQAAKHAFRGAYGGDEGPGDISPVEGYSPRCTVAAKGGVHGGAAAGASGSLGQPRAVNQQQRPASAVGVLAVPDASGPRASSAVDGGGFVGGLYGPRGGAAGSSRVLAGWLATQQQQHPLAAGFAGADVQQQQHQQDSAVNQDYAPPPPHPHHMQLLHHQHHMQRTAEELAEATALRAKSAPHPTVMMRLFDNRAQQQQLLLLQQHQQRPHGQALSLVAEDTQAPAAAPGSDGFSPLPLLHADPPELMLSAAGVDVDVGYGAGAGPAAAGRLEPLVRPRSAASQDWMLANQQQHLQLQQVQQRGRLLSPTSDVAARFAALDVSKSAGAAAGSAAASGPGGLLLPASPFAGLTLPQLSRLGGTSGSGAITSGDGAFVAQAAADGGSLAQRPFSPQLPQQRQQQPPHRSLQLVGAAAVTGGVVVGEGQPRSDSANGEQQQQQQQQQLLLLPPAGGAPATSGGSARSEGDEAMPMQQQGNRQLQAPGNVQRAASRTGLTRVCSGSTHGFLNVEEVGHAAGGRPAAGEAEEGAGAAGGSPPPYEAVEGTFEYGSAGGGGGGITLGLQAPTGPRYASATGFSRLSATSSPGVPPAAMYQSPQQQPLQASLHQAQQRRRIAFNQPPSWQAAQQHMAERAPLSAPGGGYGPGGYAAAAQLLQDASGDGGGNSDSGGGLGGGVGVRASSGVMQLHGGMLFVPGAGTAAYGSCSGDQDSGCQAVTEAAAAAAAATRNGIVTMGAAAAAAALGLSQEEESAGALAAAAAAAAAYNSAPGGGLPGGYRSVGSSGAGGGLGPGGYFSAGMALLRSGISTLADGPGMAALSAGGDLATAAAAATAASAGAGAAEGSGGGGVDAAGRRRVGRERFDDVARLLLRGNGDSGVVAMGLDSDPELMQCFDQTPADAMDRDGQ